MTRQIEIVNMSNWDGEDYEVTQLNHDGKPITETLKPCERTYLRDGYKSGGILIRPVESKTPEPFIKKEIVVRDGQRTEENIQVLPRLSVTLEG